MRLVALLGAVVLLAGCSGGGRGEPAQVPPGFWRYEGRGFTLHYPSGWRTANGQDDRGRPVVTLNGPELPSGAYDGQVHLSRWDGYPRDDLDLQLAQFRGLAKLDGYKITVSRPVRLAGAAQAHRLEAAYTVSTAAGGRIPFRLLGMYVLTERGVLLEFMLRSPAGGNAGPRLDAIFDSFRLTGK